ncbi:hypothetical protein CJD36_006320 [Flavipsychrobacter stenotrophus]|uniref:Secretion system C-terminal sorting domain-containing protein n=1 Tax=Flavipsychrobacter stenotrophus TaxID=2077091 RepID=A0A2S7SXF1_9BACT|nr:T9SS type A sorting domain-containing protein [Flavipsychrobacter stenotrophus]PQJ11414.1 hypothetical protein CJD36_006320 [Flavipsychrobacter stenotrophus]
MKRNLLVIALTSCFGILIFSSYEHGPAYEGGLNRTGSQGGAANCAGSGCHGVNAPTTIVEVKVYNSAGVAVSQYSPGANYTVAITGNNTAAGITLDEFGFQVSAVLNSSAQAGSFAVTSGTHLRVTSLGGLQIVEHKDALNDTFTNHFVARFSWTAPAAGSGDVSFYSILNPLGEDEHRGLPGGVKSKPTDDDDDEISMPNTSPVVVLTEGNGSGSNAVGNTITGSKVLFYPNPCSDILNIHTEEANAEGIIDIYATNGVRVYSGNLTSGVAIINTGNLATGIYNVEIMTGNGRMARAIVKQ